jgi:hypothetical protein
MRWVRHLVRIEGVNLNQTDITGHTPALKGIKSGPYDIHAVLDESLTSSECRTLLEIRHAVHRLLYSNPSQNGKSNNFIDQLIESLRSGLTAGTKVIIHKIQQQNLQIQSKDTSRIIQAACNNGNANLLDSMKDKSRSLRLSMDWYNGWQIFAKYGISIPTDCLRAAVSTRKKSVIEKIIRECELIDAQSIARTLELSIDFEFDGIFDHLINCIKPLKYEQFVIPSECVVCSMSVNPHHLRKLLELKTSRVDIVSAVFLKTVLSILMQPFISLCAGSDYGAHDFAGFLR